MSPIGSYIHTVSVAVGKTCLTRQSTRTRRTNLTGKTLRRTSAAVVPVGLEVDAGGTAIRQTCLARQLAGTTRAHLTHRAGVTTCTTVVVVSLDIHTLAATGSLPGWA